MHVLHQGSLCRGWQTACGRHINGVLRLSKVGCVVHRPVSRGQTTVGRVRFSVCCSEDRGESAVIDSCQLGLKRCGLRNFIV